MQNVKFNAFREINVCVCVEGENSDRNFMLELDTGLARILGKPLGFCRDWQVVGPVKSLAQ